MPASSRIRVLYLQPAPLFGGAERQAAEQASFLPKLGIELVLIGGPGQAIADWMQNAPLERFIHSRHFPAWPPQRGLRALTLPWRYLRCGVAARAEFARVVKEERINLIVASLPFAWLVGTLVARAAGIPIVWRAGASRVPLSQKIALWLLTRLLRPDLLLCNGEAVRKLFAPLVSSPVAVLPNGVDPQHFGPGLGAAWRFRPPGARIVVGFAGRLDRSKHAEDVVALAARLKERYPDVRVLVAGDGSERKACERLAREAGASNLHFLGFVADMPSFYAACDVIVLTSDSEGCSNVLLEAMHSERAVVAAAIPPVLELVHDGGTGLVYPLGEVDALFACVQRLVQSAELRATLGRTGGASVSRLTAETAAARLAEILRGVAHRNAAARRELRPARASQARPLVLRARLANNDYARTPEPGRRRTG